MKLNRKPTQLKYNSKLDECRRFYGEKLYFVNLTSNIYILSLIMVVLYFYI